MFLLSIFSKIFGGKKQNMSGGGGRADEFINTLKAELNITPDQETQIKATLQEFMQSKRSIKQGGGGKEEMRETKQDFKQDIINVLTPEQQKKFMANINMYKQLLKR